VATNKYFNHYSYRREQDLVDDLVVEAIKIFGHDVRYIPFTVVAEDPLFGEDPLRKFDGAEEIELYVKSVDGFEGEGQFLSKLGYEIQDSITFTVARRRWDQIRNTNTLLDEVGYLYQTESANTRNQSAISVSTAYANTFSITLETGTAGANTYSISSTRPLEGDLIYFPMVDRVFEIKSVSHEAIFYQTGRLQTYDLYCELFNYSAERFGTGNTTIDAIETRYSLDVLNFQFTLEDGTGSLLDESSGSYIIEHRLEDTNPTANNEYFNSGAVFKGNAIQDFSESNPFSERNPW